MAFKIGTRIKKVRGACCLGVTGVVSRGPCVSGTQLGTIGSRGKAFDMFVRLDAPFNAVNGRTGDVIPNFFRAGQVIVGVSDYWEPIIPEDHQPCEEGWTIDSLFEKVVEIA